MGSLHTFFLSENIYHIVDPEYSQNTKNRFAQAGGAVFFVDRRDSRFMPRRGKSPAGHHVVTDCTGSRRLFYLKSHLESVPSLLLSKMQTFHWFAFWLFLQRPKPVGHPAFLFILRKAGCPFLMSRKQLFRQLNNQTVAEIFERFVASQTAKGVSDKTIRNYHSHLHSLQKHLDFSASLATLTKEDLDNMVISMRQSGLAHNSISSYLRVFRTFLNWARKAGYASR